MDVYAVLGVPPNATQAELKSAHRALVRRHHPDLAPPAQRDAATRRVQEINVAYGLVRDPQRRAAYDRARGSGRMDALVTAAGRWAGRWWRLNRAAMRRSALAARQAARDVVGRVAWLGLCAVGTAAGWLTAVAGGRLVGVDGWVAPLAGALGGLAIGHRRGWHLRLRLAGLPGALRGGALDIAAVAVVIVLGMLLDARLL